MEGFAMRRIEKEAKRLNKKYPVRDRSWEETTANYTTIIATLTTVAIFVTAVISYLILESYILNLKWIVAGISLIVSMVLAYVYDWRII